MIGLWKGKKLKRITYYLIFAQVGDFRVIIIFMHALVPIY
jgi:hypothetical protein